MQEYLDGELTSPVKHEYVGGAVYAMVGARNVHNLIATNTLVSLGSHLSGKPCRPYNSDTKIRIRLPSEVRFYYPDVSVICRPNPQDDTFQDEPTVIVEVLSKGTRRIDEGEKREAYLSIASLDVYILIEQERPSVTAWRRTDEGFIPEVHQGLESTVPLPEVGVALPLAEVYEDVKFTSEPG